VKKYSAAFFMLALGLACLGLHFVIGWNAFKADAQEHQTSAAMSTYMTTWGRDVFENLQSEFIQLFFQFLLLAGFFKVIRIQAYEQDVEQARDQLDRIEARLAALRRDVFPAENGHEPIIPQRDQTQERLTVGV
jgi:hypothetical protein